VAEVQRIVFDSLTTAQVRQLEQIGERILKAAKPGASLRLPPRAAPD
jgi:hypothetical protein